jgi:hypothetical protein
VKKFKKGPRALRIMEADGQETMEASGVVEPHSGDATWNRVQVSLRSAEENAHVQRVSFQPQYVHSCIYLYASYVI